MTRYIQNVIKVLMTVLHEYSRDIIYAGITILILYHCLNPVRFASHYSYIKIEDIANELEKSHPTGTNSCAINIKIDQKWKLLYPDENLHEEPKVLAQKLNILPGGHWKPMKCNALFNVAIILPYRNRQPQLEIFINYIHNFLQAQNLDYHIFVMEQSKEHDFNRAKLFNIGYLEAMKIKSFHCLIFHDIDLIPQNLNNIYACTKMPRHMSSSVNTFRYNLPYNGLFGGAIALTSEQFKKVNGFSNVFYGWGGEDDDFYSRLQSKNLKITRFGPDVAQYYMLSHKKERPSKARFTNLETGAQRYNTDGINSLTYEILDYQPKSLYTWILVYV